MGRYVVGVVVVPALVGPGRPAAAEGRAGFLVLLFRNVGSIDVEDLDPALGRGAKEILDQAEVVVAWGEALGLAWLGLSRPGTGVTVRQLLIDRL